MMPIKLGTAIANNTKASSRLECFWSAENTTSKIDAKNPSNPANMLKKSSSVFNLLV
jgi:hypothetical protein